jgi:aminobenzoyl-glutamate utilization protein B
MMEITRWIDENKAQFTKISDKIWAYAETAYKEYKSAKLLADTLEKSGFVVHRSVAEIPTAFVANFGKGKPIIAILGEYDALPGLSQKTVPEKMPIDNDGNGHGCGHNLLGAGALAAALAIKESIVAGDVDGTIRYYGCPAEENGSAKAFMARAGLFDDVDLCLTWHPGMVNTCITVNFLSNIKVKFKFFGRASHAAADPHNGRSALDAVELMNVGVNYLREHIIPDARLHYVILKGGGLAPNVVPPYAESLYMIRAPKPDQLKPIFERVVDVAKGAALMTGTTMKNQVISGASNLVFNNTIESVLQEKLEIVGGPEFSSEEKDFACQLSSTFPPDSLGGFARLLGQNPQEIIAAAKKDIIFERILPIFRMDSPLPGSSDVGDVSWVVPTGQISTTCYAFGTPGHSWQLVAQGGMSIGHKGMLYAGKVLALSALEFMQNQGLLKKAIDEYHDRLAKNPFVPMIPDGVPPPLDL